MSKGIIRYKGFEILHRHVFSFVCFTAWKKDKKVWDRELRKENPIDWDNPLTRAEKEYLINGELI
ncbi:hypothetical protein ES705_26161 [subsurface metagenome]